MHYIRSPNQFQLRLGWLSIIAYIVGDERMGREELGRRLLEYAISTQGGQTRQEHWLINANMKSAPQGRMSQRAEPDIVRMGIIFGIYDPNAQALTDLGHVLRFVDQEHQGYESPFQWTGARRFIGLRLLWGADGDMCLSLLRRWPSDGVLSRENAPGFLADSLKILAENTSSNDEYKLLMQQAHRVQHSERAFPQDIYPRLEPLREIGYLRAGERIGDYYQTTSGRQLAEALAGVRSAEQLLEAGLSRVFLVGEHIPAPGPTADATDLRQTLVRLPSRLRGAASEAPLEPVVLLTQCNLLAKRETKWIDLHHARGLFTRLARTSKGLIGLKSGTSILEQNITWTTDANLDDETLWSVPVMDANPAAVLDVSDGSGPIAFNPSLNEEQRSTSISVPESKAPSNIDSAGMPPTQGGPPQPAAAPLLTPHERLWLQYVARLLSPPTAGSMSATRWGGPVSWVAALQRHAELPEEILSRKRDPSKSPVAPNKGDKRPFVLAIAPLWAWLDEVGSLEAREPLERCRELWVDLTVDTEALKGSLLQAAHSMGRLSAKVLILIRSFLLQTGPKVDWNLWGSVSEVTRGLVLDVVERGLWRRQELWNLLVHYLEDGSGSNPATRFLDALDAPRERLAYTFSQERIVPERLGTALEQLEQDARSVQFDDTRVELELSKADEPVPQGATCVLATVTLNARTPSQALARGREYAREALSRLSFLSTLLAPPVTGGMQEWREPSERLADGNSMPVPLQTQEPDKEAPWELALPETFGLERSTQPHELHAVRQAVAKLPALSAVDDGALVNARTRLARALHWLELAEEPGLRPKERLSHGWVAFEHLVTEGREGKGAAVMTLATSAVALCHVRALMGSVWRDVLAGLHASLCSRPGDIGLLEHARTCLGEELARWYESKPTPPMPLPRELRLTDRNCLDRILERRSHLSSLANDIEPQAPFAAWRLRRVAVLLNDREQLARELIRLRLEAASILMRVYEIRNQLVHEASTFGFDDAYRLEDLYARYRVLINPVVAEVMRLADGRLLGTPLFQAWSLLKARFDELVDVNSSKQQKGSPVLVDAEHLLSCLEG